MSQSFQPQTSFSVFPPVIKNLLILNGLVFFAQMVPATDQILLRYFALWPPGLPDFANYPQFYPWQVVTYGFLHGSIGHLLLNMYALWMFGVQIENAWGSQRFALFYFVCVIGAAFIQMVVMWGTPIPTVGASGGVFGILLAFGMMFPNEYIMLLFPPIPIKAKYLVMGYGAIELFSGIAATQSSVAHFAHLGGMLFGFLLIQYWRGKLPVRPRQTMYF